MKRADAFALVTKHGGKPRQRITKDTQVLIVGELGWPLQNDGQPSNSLTTAKSYGIPIISERRFLEWVGKSSPEEQAKSYSAAELAALSKLPIDVVEQLSMFGLIETRDGLYGFRDLAAARQVAQLLDSGIMLSVITRSLREIRNGSPMRGFPIYACFRNPRTRSWSSRSWAVPIQKGSSCSRLASWT